MRVYKTGSRWAFWRWAAPEAGYIRRLHLIQTPWFAICLHRILTPDPEPYLHDHPVTFLSIILRGWYVETRKQPGRRKRAIARRWFNFIRASFNDRHSIKAVSPGGALTLCIMGPKRRDWGFHTSPKGWVYWRLHNAAKYGKAAT